MFSSSDRDEEPNDEDDNEEGGDQIDFETVEPYRDSDSESELEQLRRVSDFELLYGSDKEVSTALAALAFLYGSGRGHAVVWAGRIEDDSSSDDDMPYNWASGRGRTRRLQTCQAEPGAEDEPEPLVHPSLESDPHREGSKFQITLLKWFLTSL